jgi:hypothetical protein
LTALLQQRLRRLESTVALADAGFVIVQELDADGIKRLHYFLKGCGIRSDRLVSEVFPSADCLDDQTRRCGELLLRHVAIERSRRADLISREEQGRIHR